MLQFGSWFTTKPKWETKLDNASDNVLKKTGMSRNELKRVLEHLHDEGIIE